MHKYLTDLLGMPLMDPDGRRVGRIHDVIARIGDRLPVVSAVFARGDGREGWMSIDDVVIDDGAVRLCASWGDTAPYVPDLADLRLQRDVLDKQIVDVHDYRVVRVNDVRFAQVGDRTCVVGVDAGLRALLRRTGVGRPVEWLAALVRRPLHSELIAWDDVETLEPSGAGGGRIKLKVPHEKIAKLHPADIADIVEQLNPQQRTEVIEALDVETAADTIEEMEEKEAAEVMETLEEERAADILEEMEPDAAADVLGDLTEARSEELLGHMEPDEAADVKELLAYAEETAGGLMTTEFVAIQEHVTADQAIEHMRVIAPKAETAYYVYVVDAEGRLEGVLSLRDLIVAKPDTAVGKVMVRSVRTVRTGDHADEVSHTVSRYNLLALPVVDDEGRLVGIVTVDDMMERLLPPDRRRKLPQVALDES